jgi:predicted  nucleic acid-binding Zn-ribbon protein
MSNYSTESLLIDLQRTIKHLEDSINEKNKEIENLKGLVFKLQDLIDPKVS